MPRIVDIANAGWRAVLNDLGKITKIFDNEGDDINIPLLETHPVTGEMVGLSKPNGQVVTLRTSPNAVVLLGDSRTAVNRIVNQGTNLAAYNSSGVFSQLRARSGQRLRLLYNGGVSGERTDQIAARVDTAISYFPGLVIYWAGINDIAQSYPSGTTSAATAFANIKAAGEKCIASGAQFLVFADYPATGWTAAQVSQLFELNARLSYWAQTTSGVLLFDTCRYMLDYTTATAPTQRTGYTYDGVHPSMRGAYVLGKALDGFISSSIPNLGQNGLLACKTTLPQTLGSCWLTGTTSQHQVAQALALVA